MDIAVSGNAISASRASVPLEHRAFSLRRVKRTSVAEAPRIYRLCNEGAIINGQHLNKARR
jgi:hypothetical protein